MRDRHGFRFAGANLVYGVFDLGVPSHCSTTDATCCSTASLASRSAVVPDASLLRHPDVSPLYANLSGLCPALFTVGTLDRCATARSSCTPVDRPGQPGRSRSSRDR
jgi:acetyl esterase/lipase